MTFPEGGVGHRRRRSIGATTSLVLARAGADVVINYNTSRDEANKVRGKIAAMGRRAVTIHADVADVVQCEELVRQAEAAFGRVDILVSNSGTGQPHKIVDTTYQEWDRVMNVNARATFVLARKLLPGMMERKFGRFVTISSNIAVYGTGGGSFATYAASKAALIAMTKGIAHEARHTSRRTPSCRVPYASTGMWRRSAPSRSGSTRTSSFAGSASRY